MVLKKALFFKNSVPRALCPVYNLSCAKSASVYYDSAKRTLQTRVSEHKGVSDRTGKPQVKPNQSSIRDYVMICGSGFSYGKTLKTLLPLIKNLICELYNKFSSMRLNQHDIKKRTRCETPHACP